MDAEYKAFRNYLSNINCTSLRQLCRLAGFTEDEIPYITLYYGEGKTEDCIADTLSMSVDSYHRNKKRLIRKLQHFCHTIYYPEVTSYTERIRRLDELLHK